MFGRDNHNMILINIVQKVAKLIFLSFVVAGFQEFTAASSPDLVPRLILPSMTSSLI